MNTLTDYRNFNRSLLNIHCYFLLLSFFFFCSSCLRSPLSFSPVLQFSPFPPFHLFQRFHYIINSHSPVPFLILRSSYICNFDIPIFDSACHSYARRFLPHLTISFFPKLTYSCFFFWHYHVRLANSQLSCFLQNPLRQLLFTIPFFTNRFFLLINFSLCFLLPELPSSLFSPLLQIFSLLPRPFDVFIFPAFFTCYSHFSLFLVFLSSSFLRLFCFAHFACLEHNVLPGLAPLISSFSLLSTTLRYSLSRSVSEILSFLERVVNFIPYFIFPSSIYFYQPRKIFI